MVRGRGRRLAVLVLAMSLIFAMGAGAADAAKKKKKGKKGPAPVNITQVGGPVPDRAPGATGIFGRLISTINVPNAYKGLRARDVNVTLSFLGAGPGPNSLVDMLVLLTAPDGSTSELVLNGLSGNLAGPLTIDDQSPLYLAGTATPFGDPDALLAPYQGTAQTDGVPLKVHENGRVPGTWTLNVLDTIAGDTSLLSSWRLNVVAGKPFQTK